MTPLDIFLERAKAKHAEAAKTAASLFNAEREVHNTYLILLRIVEAQADLLRRAEPTIVGTEAWTLALADVAAIVEGAGK